MIDKRTKTNEEKDPKFMTREERLEDLKKKKYRNLRKDEIKDVILGFTQILKNININGKPLVVNATSKAITMNPKIEIEEIQSVFGVDDRTKLDFIRQLYIRSGAKLIQELFPDEYILNAPLVSFEENGITINMRY